MTPEAIRTLYDYNQYASSRLWYHIMRLSDEQFTGEADCLDGSVRSHLFSIMNTEREWMNRIAGLTPPPRLNPVKYDDKESTRKLWNEIEGEMMDYVRSMTQDELDDDITWELPDHNIKARNKRWELLLHVVNHGTDHRAQILSTLDTEFGIKSFDNGVLYYLMDRDVNSYYFGDFPLM